MTHEFDPRDYGFEPDETQASGRRNRTRATGLPDPEMHAGFYEDVAKKRFAAWIVDTILVGLMTGLVIIFTAFLTIFIAPFIFLLIGFIYRWMTISSRSATLGMRMMGIELRNSDGNPFDGSMALLHTLGYSLSFAFFLLQLLSIGIMVTSNKGQGLTDMVLGTAMINSLARS